jgi:hypothetical protein
VVIPWRGDTLTEAGTGRGARQGGGSTTDLTDLIELAASPYADAG